MTRFFRLLSLTLLAGDAWAAPNPYLAQAKQMQQGLEFEKCLKRLETAANWNSNAERDFADIELYQALCLLGLGKEKEAAEHFELALRIDRSLELPPLQGPRVVAIFKKVQASMTERYGPNPPPAPMTAPPPPPRVEPSAPPPADAPVVKKVTPPAPAPSAADIGLLREAPKKRSLVLPIAFGAATVVGAAVAVILGVTAQATARQANSAEYQAEALLWGSSARGQAVASNIAWGVTGATGIAAVVTLLLGLL